MGSHQYVSELSALHLCPVIHVWLFVWVHKRWLTRENSLCRWRPLRPVTREPLAVCDFRSLDEQSDLVGVMSVLPTRGQHPVYGGSNPKNSTGEIERWVWQQLFLSIITCVCICPTTDNLFFSYHQGIGLQSRSQVVLCLQHATRRMFVSQMLRLSYRWYGTMYATFCFHDGAGRRTSKREYRSSMYRDLGLNNITTD